MAIVLDANLGSTDGSSVATLTLTTTAAAVAAARVVVLVSYFNSSTPVITGVTVAGTACTQDKRTVNGADQFEVWSCHRAASTPVSSSVIVTFTSNSGMGAILIGAASFTGVLSSGALVTTGSSTSTGTAWSSGAATNTGFADALYIGGAGNEDITAATSSTATNGIELHDRYRTADQQGLATGYQIVSTVASRAITGNLSNSASTANTGALAVYADAGSGAAAAPLQRRNQIVPMVRAANY